MSNLLQYMRLAIELGEKGRLTAPPNPWVGCVVVKNGQIFGEGFHRKAGEPHAEVHALNQAMSEAENSTVFVTLEPCAHHGRTPPCVEALVKAKVKEVYIALQDPDPRVSGKGIQFLKDAGINVQVGLGKELAEQSLRPYLHQRKLGRPYCVVKTAISLDGKIAAPDGSSQWITGDAARRNAHEMRAESQAILVGSGTVLADKPQLTVRNIPLPDGFEQPMRVLLDSRGRVTPKDFQANLVFTSEAHYQKKWEAQGAEVHVMPQIELEKVLQILNEKGILQVMVEGGQGLNTSFLSEGLADQLTIYLGACLLGHSQFSFNDLKIGSINTAKRLKLLHVHQLNQDLRLDYLCSQEL